MGSCPEGMIPGAGGKGCVNAPGKNGGNGDNPNFRPIHPMWQAQMDVSGWQTARKGGKLNKNRKFNTGGHTHNINHFHYGTGPGSYSQMSASGVPGEPGSNQQYAYESTNLITFDNGGPHRHPRLQSVPNIANRGTQSRLRTSKPIMRRGGKPKPMRKRGRKFHQGGVSNFPPYGPNASDMHHGPYGTWNGGNNNHSPNDQSAGMQGMDWGQPQSLPPRKPKRLRPRPGKPSIGTPVRRRRKMKKGGKLNKNRKMHSGGHMHKMDPKVVDHMHLAYQTLPGEEGGWMRTSPSVDYNNEMISPMGRYRTQMDNASGVSSRRVRKKGGKVRKKPIRRRRK